MKHEDLMLTGLPFTGRSVSEGDIGFGYWLTSEGNRRLKPRVMVSTFEFDVVEAYRKGNLGWRRGVTQVQLAKQYDVPVSRIRKALEKGGIQLRKYLEYDDCRNPASAWTCMGCSSFNTDLRRYCAHCSLPWNHDPSATKDE